jgi:hypothetical protein
MFTLATRLRAVKRNSAPVLQHHCYRPGQAVKVLCPKWVGIPEKRPSKLFKDTALEAPVALRGLGALPVLIVPSWYSARSSTAAG